MTARSSDRDKQILRLLPLVKKIAYRLASRMPMNVDVDDLISAGNLAAIACVDNRDTSQAATWAAYMHTRLHGAMIDYLRHVDPVPRSVHRRAQWLREAHDVLSKQLKRKPTRSEVAAYLGMSMNDLDVFESSAIEHRTVSIDTPLGGDDDDLTIADTLADAPVAESGTFKEQAIRQAITALPPREAGVLEAYVIDGLYLEEIGQQLGVSGSRISQLMTKATKLIGQVNSRDSSGEIPQHRQRPRRPRPNVVLTTTPLHVSAVELPSMPPPLPPICTAKELIARLESLHFQVHPSDPATVLRRQLGDHVAHLRAIGVTIPSR